LLSIQIVTVPASSGGSSCKSIVQRCARSSVASRFSSAKSSTRRPVANNSATSGSVPVRSSG
jgi:hypothetical protein